jgi:hypothetical protein
VNCVYPNPPCQLVHDYDYEYDHMRNYNYITNMTKYDYMTIRLHDYYDYDCYGYDYIHQWGCLEAPHWCVWWYTSEGFGGTSIGVFGGTSIGMFGGVQ